MMGKSHLLLGSAGWLTIGVPLTELASNAQLGPAEVAAGLVVCAGAAMFPDLDHPQATVSRSLGPVTQSFSKFFSRVMGGHRNGSHSILFAAGIFFLLSLVFGRETDGVLTVVAFGICLLSSSLVLRVLTRADGLISAILSAIIAATLLSVTAGAPTDNWIIYAVAIGILLHDLGDAMTVEGVPLFYPMSRKRYKFPIVGRTDSMREKIVAAASGILATILLFVMVYQPILDSNKINVNKNIASKAKGLNVKAPELKGVTSEEAFRLGKKAAVQRMEFNRRVGEAAVNQVK